MFVGDSGVIWDNVWNRYVNVLGKEVDIVFVIVGDILVFE